MKGKQVRSDLNSGHCVNFQRQYPLHYERLLAQSAGVTEYTVCISAEREDFPNESPAYDIKQSVRLQ